MEYNIREQIVLMDFPDHSRRILHSLRDQQMQGFLCDCQVIVGTAHFLAHHSVLASCSPFFHMLCREHPDTRDLTLNSQIITAPAFSLLLNFMYCGRLSFQEAPAEDVLAAASYLHMDEVVRVCKKRLQGRALAEAGSTQQKEESSTAYIKLGQHGMECGPKRTENKQPVPESMRYQQQDTPQSTITPHTHRYPIGSQDTCASAQASPYRDSPKSGSTQGPMGGSSNFVRSQESLSVNNQILTMPRLSLENHTEAGTTLSVSGSFRCSLQTSQPTGSAMATSGTPRYCVQSPQFAGNAEVQPGAARISLQTQEPTGSMQLAPALPRYTSQVQEPTGSIITPPGLSRYFLQSPESAGTMHVVAGTSRYPLLTSGSTTAKQREEGDCAKSELSVTTTTHPGMETATAPSPCSSNGSEVHPATVVAVKVEAIMISDEECDRGTASFKRHDFEKEEEGEEEPSSIHAETMCLQDFEGHPGSPLFPEEVPTCKTCGKTFSSSYTLRRHATVHTRERPYECHYCFRTYTQSGNLYRHIHKVHSHLEPSPKKPNVEMEPYLT